VKENSEKKVTVEDLLRLKRAERPPAEFWNRFEAEIRAKQLSAIVIRRPWWSGLAGIGRVLRRHQALFGAGAVAAVTLAAYRFTEARPVRRAEPAPAAAAPSAPNAAVSAPAAPARSEDDFDVSSAAPAPAPVVTEAAAHITRAPAAAVPHEQPPRSPFSDGIAVTLADFRESVTDVSNSPFSTDRDFEAEIAPSRAPASEPLARMDPAAERRARLLSPGIPASSNRTFASDWMRQRASTNDRMYESMDREPSDAHALVGFRF
jgi:hypothetical protein